MALPVSMLVEEMDASTRERWTSSAISMRPPNSVKRPCTLEIPRCWATAATEECTGSSDQVPGGGSSTPPCRARTTVPASTRPLAVTSAVDAAGAYPTAVTITVYAAGLEEIVGADGPVLVGCGTEHLGARHVGHRDDGVLDRPAVPRTYLCAKSHPVFSPCSNHS